MTSDFDKDHRHKWHTFTKADMLICGECNTVSRLQDVLRNNEVKATWQARINVISKLLFDRELKKSAHDREYAWIAAQNEKTNILENNQMQLTTQGGSSV